MKTFPVSAAACAAVLMFAGVGAGSANARCLYKTTNGRTARRGVLPRHAAPKPADTPTAPAVEPSIAGFWYVQFLADEQLVDDGFDMWLSDGTEILNDSPAPAAGDVCMGVWTKTAPYTYTLKHPSWIFDDTNTNLIGVVIIRETITLDPGGNSFTGTSTATAYDLSGNLLGEEDASVTGERMTAVDDPTVTTPIPGLPASLLNR